MTYYALLGAILAGLAAMQPSTKEKEMGRKIQEEGLDVEVYRRNSDGLLVVDIQTEGLESKDTHDHHRIPKIVIRINEQAIEVLEDGVLRAV